MLRPADGRGGRAPEPRWHGRLPVQGDHVVQVGLGDCSEHAGPAAARDEGVNAIYLALQDIQWIKDYRFEKISPTLGPVKATVTQIEAGSQHNVVPDACRYVIDVRTQECYTNREVFDILQEHTLAELTARSFRLNPSGISSDHPLVQAGIALGMKTYGSPTLSDQALCAFPTVKIGPGDSARSHTADEFIRLSEVETGIKMYIQLMSAFARRGTDEMVIGY